MGALDAIVRELAEVRYELDALPQTAPISQRVQLEDRLAALRERAAIVRSEYDMPRTADEVREELRRVEGQLDALIRKRINLVSQAGGSRGGDFGNTYFAMQVNKEIDVAQGRADLEERIRELRRELESADD